MARLIVFRVMIVREKKIPIGVSRWAESVSVDVGFLESYNIILVLGEDMFSDI